jgi:hypothetical protein
MVPDLGAGQRRLIRKARREVEKRRAASDEFKKLVSADLFSLTVLTAFREKAERMQSVLSQERWHCRVVVVPTYDELLLGSGGEPHAD